MPPLAPPFAPPGRGRASGCDRSADACAFKRHDTPGTNAPTRSPKQRRPCARLAKHASGSKLTRRADLTSMDSAVRAGHELAAGRARRRPVHSSRASGAASLDAVLQASQRGGTGSPVIGPEASGTPGLASVTSHAHAPPPVSVAKQVHDWTAVMFVPVVIRVQPTQAGSPPSSGQAAASPWSGHPPPSTEVGAATSGTSRARALGGSVWPPEHAAMVAVNATTPLHPMGQP